MPTLQVRDVHFAFGMLFLLLGVVATYLVRTFVWGRARHARSDEDGGSVFLHKSAMEMGYWLLDPLVSALVSLEIAPNMVTLFSVVPALLAAIAAAFGWFALACVLATLGSLCDLLDGVLARRLGVASDAGEVYDAAVDRYVEFLFLGGVAIYYRTHWMVLLLTMAALLGSFMVSYTTAKAEAMSVPPPRGAMRRAERAVYLLVAAGLTAFTRAAFADSPSHALREAPMLVALSLVAVVTNVSAVQRFMAIASALRVRNATPPKPANRSGGIVAKPRPPASST
ncbi:MAG TPA: CDP-alcohol phosphatidyltransferase family protein [Polyangia bacterium]|jgi:CDP-diacylglycerol--glycerol-3-phosphate 3-phosphatidyltransferase|nr:CDP-alcohol phosphatidyltransferase family protein [Polyangia bacterium]